MSEYPILETKRLALRPLHLADAAEIQRLAGDFAIADTTLTIPHPYPDGAAQEWIQHCHTHAWPEGNEVTLAVLQRAEQRFIGAICLCGISRVHLHAEMGYWIGVPWWGKGYCTEAARAMIAFGFTELGLNRILAMHFRRNPASGRVMEKAGMTREGCLRSHVKRWDKFEDLVQYAILRSEWQAQPGEGSAAG